MAQSAEMGALLMLYAATAPAMEGGRLQLALMGSWSSVAIRRW